MIYISKGKKTIKYNDKLYFIYDLMSYKKNIDLSHLFSSGEILDTQTGEMYDINDIDKLYNEKYSELLSHADVLGYDKKNKLKQDSLDKDMKKLKITELESKCKCGTIDLDNLKELISLKYGNTEYNISYESFIKLNNKIPNLSDSELGKFYKILSRLSHNANTLLSKKDIRSKPLDKFDISELLGIDIKPIERYLKILKDKNIIKKCTMGDNSYYMINPVYAFNGVNIGSYTYMNFKDDIDEVSKIPEEVKLLWEYEFINSTIKI